MSETRTTISATKKQQICGLQAELCRVLGHARRIEMLEADPEGCLENAATTFREAEQYFALCGLTSYAGRTHKRRAQVESVLASLSRPGASDEPAARDQAENKKQK